MKYQISEKVTKQDKNGKDYIRATLTSETGEVFRNIGAFRGEFIGDVYEGELERNGDFWNLKPKVVLTNNFPTGGKPNYIVKNMEKKAENIEHAQDRKDQGIANSGSITNATSLVVAMINAGIIPSTGSEQDVINAVLKYAKWYRTMYSSPSNDQDIPF